jgi:O-antigen/teichoic acid export membrane protein
MFSFKALKQLWGFGFRMFLSTLLETIYSKLDIIIIGKLFTPAVLGFFDQAKRLDLLITQLSSGSIMAVMFPVLSKVQNDLIRFQNIIFKTLGIIIFVVFFLLGSMYLISEEFIVLLYGEKWLPTVDYFKILVLSGFSYPISALLVNILSSRGNSRAFLKLEIYKKILQSINFYVGFLWGIEGYLYGWLIVSIIGMLLNILFASRETKSHFLLFVKPIVLQILITVSIVFIVIVVTEDIETHTMVLLLLKGILFTIMYFMINMFLKTNSYVYFKNEALQLLQRRKQEG